MKESRTLKELIQNNRSYRRFFQQTPIVRQQLLEWIDLARLSASGANLQSLKYILSYEEKRNGIIFPLLKWAGYLKDWDGPVDGEKPSAYIIMLSDKQIRQNFSSCDHGIACQSILLGAVEAGFGGCILQSVDFPAMRVALEIPERFEPLCVIALGKPKETVVIEDLGESGDIKYYRDAEGIHHVPKRNLKDLIIDL
jgi:nitroreductase